MKRQHTRRGMTLMELLIAGLIMSLVGIGIYNMIRASYDSQDRIINRANLRFQKTQMLRCKRWRP